MPRQGLAGYLLIGSAFAGSEPANGLYSAVDLVDNRWLIISDIDFMYHRYFGLTEEPFSIAVNPRYLFMSDRHRDALAHLLYGVRVGGGFILLTGEVGTGKTTINRCLLKQVPENTDIALVLNPALDAIELLATVCDELGISYTSEEKTLKILTDKLHQFLLANHTKGRNTVLLIDEAQHLQFGVLEQIRLLTNLETETKKLLQIILVGQPELQSHLSQPALRQIAQRITARYQLEPLNLQETAAYIRHRLQVAGLPANQELFAPAIVKGIHRASRGIPRMINILCDRMLLGTYGQNRSKVDKHMMRQAIEEVTGNLRAEKNTVSSGFTYSLAALLIVCIVGLLAWSLTINPRSPLSAVAHSEAAEVSRESTIGSSQQQLGAAIASMSSDAQLSPSEALADNNHTALIEPLVTHYWYDNQQLALTKLLSYLELRPENADTEPCGSAVRCELHEAETWPALLMINRPAILELTTPGRFRGYAALVGVSDDRAMLVIDNNIKEVPLEELGKLWNGKFLFIWQPPESYQSNLKEGESGSIIQWLASQFAAMDNENTLLANEHFNQALTERVKIFQRGNNLDADGVVGLNTLLRINEKMGIDETLITRQTVELPAVGEG